MIVKRLSCWIVGSVVLLGGCEQAVDPDPMVFAVVYGVVSDSLGTPVAGARVGARGFANEDCGGGATLEGLGAATAEGRYRVVAWEMGPRPFVGCLKVIATDSVGGAADTIVVREARFWPTPLADSIRVDLRVRAGA